MHNQEWYKGSSPTHALYAFEVSDVLDQNVTDLKH